MLPTNHRRRHSTISVVGWIVSFAAPALQLDPIVDTWRRSTTYVGPVSSRGILWLIVLPSSIVHSNCQARTSTTAQYHGKTSTRWALRRHFLDHHPQDLVVLPSEGSVPFLKCKRCGMQAEIGTLYGGHRHTRLCREGWAKKKQHEAAEAARVTLQKCLRPMRTTWREWRCSSIWGGCWHTTTMIPRLCEQT